LLWAPSSHRQLESGLMLLSSWESAGGLKADGEIVLRDGASVAWREFLTAPVRVLVKHPTHVSLLDRTTALANLSET
jgi:phosphoribosyl-dephospho-CoA transferase